MRLFISAGEPSGDMHGANLIRSLRALRPDIEVVGFGGERMAAAGCRLVYPLCDLAVIGFGAVLANVTTFAHVLGLAREEFQRQRPDAVVLIDYPGFHWWLAGCAKKHGIPVSYFVPPQLWAWGGWRARKMRRLTDQVLCSLPFEQEWFAQRGVTSQYIGHPYFDELHQQRLDNEFLGEQRRRAGTVIAMLPGSRQSELNHNLSSLARAATQIYLRRPDTRFLVACLKAKHADEIRSRLASLRVPFEVHHGRTTEIIQLAHSCLSVSGSVSLELLYRGKPSVMFYTLTPITMWIVRRLVTLKFFTLVNLLAKRRLFPEYATSTRGGTIMTGESRTTGELGDYLAGHVLNWLNDRNGYEILCGELAALKRQVAEPGACARAAAAILNLAQGRKRRAA